VKHRGFITIGGPFDQPLSHVRNAMLVLALTLGAVVCAELSIDRPRMTHAIKIDAWDPQYLPPSMLRYGATDVLKINADGSMSFSGAAVADLRQLRLLIDLEQQRSPVPTLQVEPAPDLRYADFLDVLAVIKRAHVYDYCIDFDPERQLLAEFKCPRRPVLE